MMKTYVQWNTSSLGPNPLGRVRKVVTFAEAVSEPSVSLRQEEDKAYTYMSPRPFVGLNALECLSGLTSPFSSELTYDPTTGVFTVEREGVYHFYVFMEMKEKDDQRFLGIRFDNQDNFSFGVMGGQVISLSYSKKCLRGQTFCFCTRGLIENTVINTGSTDQPLLSIVRSFFV